MTVGIVASAMDVAPDEVITVTARSVKQLSFLECNSNTSTLAFAYLDIKELGAVQCCSQTFRRFAASPYIWRGIALTYDLPARFWSELSPREAKKNFALIKGISKTFWKHFKEKTFPAFWHKWEPIVSLEHENLPLREQFCAHIKPAICKLSEEQIDWMLAKHQFYPILELAVACGVQLTAKTFTVVANRFDRREMSGDVFALLLQHNIPPHSLDFFWQFVTDENRESTMRLLQKILENPRFKAPPNTLHQAVCAGAPFPYLTLIHEKTGTQAFPKTDRESATLDAGIDRYRECLRDFICLMLKAGAIPTDDTLSNLFGIYSTTAVLPQDLFDAVDLLLKSMPTTPSSRLLTKVCRLNSPALAERLFAAGVRPDTSPEHSNSLDAAISASPEMVVLFLRFGAKPSWEHTHALLKQNYGENSQLFSELERAIFPDGVGEKFIEKAPVEKPNKLDLLTRKPLEYGNLSMLEWHRDLSLYTLSFLNGTDLGNVAGCSTTMKNLTDMMKSRKKR